ncbi:MAG: hypothetical protein GWP03_06435 [Proteobacteria bacterium]|nr:hypothetical protein [Pseudomonadota bacterium]
MISIIKIIYFLYLLIREKPENLKLEDKDYIMYFIIFLYFKFYVRRVKNIFITLGSLHLLSVGNGYESEKNKCKKGMYTFGSEGIK